MTVRRSIFWAFSGQIASAAIAFGSSVIIARLLTPYEFGLNAIAVATSGILSVIATSGADAFIIREVKLTRQVIATATTVNTILFSFLSLTLLGVSFAAKPLLGDANAGVVVRILAVLPLLNIFTFRPAAMLQRQMRFKAAALVALAAVTVNNGVTIASILLGASYVGPAIGAVSGVVTTLIFYAFINPTDLRPSFSLSGIRVMALFGLRMMSVSGSGQIVQYASQIILGRLLGVEALGIYSRATLLANFIFSQFYGTATRVVFSHMSKVNRETGDIKETFVRSLYTINSIIWPLLLNLVFLSGPAMRILYGGQWGEAAKPFSILMLTQIAWLTFGMHWELFVIRDKLKIQARYEIARSVIGLILFSIGCMFSMPAAAAGRLVEALIGSVLYFPWLPRLSGARYSEILAIYLRAGLIAVATAVPSLALMMLTGWNPAVPLAPLLGAIALGTVIWVGGLLVVSHPLLSESRMLWALGRRSVPSPLSRLLQIGRSDAAAAPQVGDDPPTGERF